MKNERLLCIILFLSLFFIVTMEIGAFLWMNMAAHTPERIAWAAEVLAALGLIDTILTLSLLGVLTFLVVYPPVTASES